jgi:hypothetical protein
MPSVQSSKSSQSKSRGKTASSQEQTGERDPNYNLISVLYHALQGAETISQYIASSKGDEELQEFLETTRDDYKRVASEARGLLADRLEASEDEEDEEEEADEE